MGRVFAHDGVDQSAIALWLGHESVETTQMYMYADQRLKEQALSSCSVSWRASDYCESARLREIHRSPFKQQGDPA
jgi:hypothetical protein